MYTVCDLILGYFNSCKETLTVTKLTDKDCHLAIRLIVSPVLRDDLLVGPNEHTRFLNPPCSNSKETIIVPSWK